MARRQRTLKGLLIGVALAYAVTAADEHVKKRKQKKEERLQKNVEDIPETSIVIIEMEV